MINEISQEIKRVLKKTAPELTQEQLFRRDKIINSDNPDSFGYGHKISDIEKIVKKIYTKRECSFDIALNVFKLLFKSNIHEEKFAAVFFLNLFKKYFTVQTIDFFYEGISKHCDSWAICDSTCIRVIGPFLGKKGNQDLAKKTINTWANDDNLWIRRASMVIMLKIVMMRKEFDKIFVFKLVEHMLQYPEDYIHKGIGWLLKTCSNYEPDTIYDYLIKNKNTFPRLILRYASEKLSKEKRTHVLSK
jgi:3-methyladenine DNA glycosylase AlkD